MVEDDEETGCSDYELLEIARVNYFIMILFEERNLTSEQVGFMGYCLHSGHLKRCEISLLCKIKMHLKLDQKMLQYAR